MQTLESYWNMLLGQWMRDPLSTARNLRPILRGLPYQSAVRNWAESRLRRAGEWHRRPPQEDDDA